MLANSIIIIISLNQWSKILTRTFNLNVTHGQYSFAKVTSQESLMKRLKMSEENSKSNLVETPTTSGSCPSKYECKKETCNEQQSTENGECSKQEDIIMMNPIMVMESVKSTITKREFCQSSNKPEFSVSESIRKRYWSKTDEDGSSGCSKMGSKKDEKLLTLRTWDKTTMEKRNTKPGFIFSLMCYNVLAQDLLTNHPYLYHNHDPTALPWKTRWKNLLREIKKSSPDIFCLQEVQESHLKDYFSVFEALGYQFLYKKRTNIRTDGCAIYYKAELFNLVEYTTVEYYQPCVQLLNRDNVGIVAKFVPKLHPTREFVVATTHLLYNLKRQDIRLAQMQVLLTEVERFSYSRSSESGYLPIILTGDLNSTPDSAVYHFISRGPLNYESFSPNRFVKDRCSGKVLLPPNLGITDNCQHIDLLDKRSRVETVTRSEEDFLIELFHSGKPVRHRQCNNRAHMDPNLYGTGTLSHNFTFTSVYNHGRTQDTEGTTCQERWVTVDYIFYSIKKDRSSEDKLKLLARYRLPTESELEDVRIPNSVLGSDHLSLMAKFKLEF